MDSTSDLRCQKKESKNLNMYQQIIEAKQQQQTKRREMEKNEQSQTYVGQYQVFKDVYKWGLEGKKRDKWIEKNLKKQ